MEIWKDIKWYEWKYQISNLWNIKTFNWKNTGRIKINKWHNSSKWYMSYALVDNLWNIFTTKIHRLVYCTFNNIDFKEYDPYDKTIICHRNDIKTDNKLDNLFLWSAKDNHDDMVNKWRRADFKWENNSFSKLNNDKVIKIKQLLFLWNKTHKEIWEVFNIHRTTVTWINSWKSWKHITI